METEEERGGLLQSYSASNISFPAPLCSSLPCCSSTSRSLLLPKAIVTNSSLTLAARLAAPSAPKTSPTYFGSSSSAAGIRYLHTGHDPFIPNHLSMQPPWNRCLHGISLTTADAASSSEAVSPPTLLVSPSRHTGHSSSACSSPGSTILMARQPPPARVGATRTAAPARPGR
ncbi:uncharacterized protein LOC108951558 isoform X2 [Musa acuminata AAA Group]|uniref:uncharacterized protein LOC108951558 isoform X2 n=1 Tax=Musa acuminata AAA Group TaxID=214697 RepID=UPI0031DB2BE0